jgi:hypothetical protein
MTVFRTLYPRVSQDPRLVRVVKGGLSGLLSRGVGLLVNTATLHYVFCVLGIGNNLAMLWFLRTDRTTER